jgi:hypothetical protein
VNFPCPDCGGADCVCTFASKLAERDAELSAARLELARVRGCVLQAIDAARGASLSPNDAMDLELSLKSALTPFKMLTPRER